MWTAVGCQGRPSDLLERNGVEVVSEAGTGQEAVDRARRLRPDVVLMDIRVPELDGIESTRRLLASPDGAPRVLILTTFDQDEYVYEAVRAGASGFLLKDAAPDDLVHAVRVVARGGSMVASAVTRRLLERFVRRPMSPSPQVAALSERESAVARPVAKGMSNADIAGQL